MNHRVGWGLQTWSRVGGTPSHHKGSSLSPLCHVQGLQGLGTWLGAAWLRSSLEGWSLLGGCGTRRRDSELVRPPPTGLTHTQGPPVGGGTSSFPISARQCANLTFGFMTLFLYSKCHGKCQAKAGAGRGGLSRERRGLSMRCQGPSHSQAPDPPLASSWKPSQIAPCLPGGRIWVSLGCCDLDRDVALLCLLPRPRWGRLWDLPEVPSSLGPGQP